VSIDKTYKFDEQLDIGKKGETAFLEKFKNEIALQEGCKDPDFIIIETGELIEFKTDGWLLTSKFSKEIKGTNNLFMEYYSDWSKQTIGGPWRAKEEGCKYFIYYFINSDLFFIFFTDQLVDSLDIITEEMSLIPIKNVRWITAGYPINQNLLIPIAYISKIKYSNTLNECLNALKNKMDKLDNNAYIRFIEANR
jgi:hypothetical protein